jgi:surface protein
MKINGIDIGLSSGLTNPSTFVGSANGMQNSEQQISDVNTFIFTVRPTIATKVIVLPLVSTGTYSFWIDWGDGVRDFVRAYTQTYSGETAVRTHTYLIGAKDYTIRIKGLCRGWSYFGLASEQPKLRSIEQFGCLELIDDLTNGSQFGACVNLDLSNVKDTLKTTYLTSMLGLFNSDTNLNINLLNNWNVRNITIMSSLFNVSTNFNQPIGNWDVSNVTSMIAMLSNTAFNQNISSWNTSSVTSFYQMFFTNQSFNQTVDTWNVSSAQDMSGMFYNATSFLQPLANWERSTVGNTSTLGNVLNMSNMFRGSTPFNQDISNWNVSKVTNMFTMFTSNALFNQPLNSWNVGAVTNMGSMFEANTAFNQPLNSWNTSSVTNMANMFNNNTAFNQNIGSWNVSNVTSTGFINFMGGKTPATFSAANLDAIYSGWSSRTSASNASISFGTANYTTAGGGTGRAILVSRGWTIVDGGGI